MRSYVVKRASLEGEITLPPSKSQTLRAILFAALGSGESRIHQFLDSPDTHAMIHACRLFGAEISIVNDVLVIQGVSGAFPYFEDVVHAGNSGIVLRFCSAIGALCSHPVVVTGDDSIRHNRPMGALLEGLACLGVKVQTMRGDGMAPVIIQGPMQGGKASLSGEDSQPVSALLIAAAFAKNPIEITVHSPGETPWVALTLAWLKRLGIPFSQRGFEWFRLEGNSAYPGFEYHVPGDLSSAAFPIAAALITGSEITLRSTGWDEEQGDKALIALLQRMGALIEIDRNFLKIKRGGILKGVEVDINAFIDVLPILAVIGCYAEGRTVIRNAAIARKKECNRLETIVSELKKMGASIEETEDGLIVERSCLRGADVFSYHDHRIAMALSVAALGAEGKTTVSAVDCTAKTCPNFFRDFNTLGANLELI